MFLLKPGIKLMNQLKYTYKFLLLGVIVVFSFAIFLHSIVSNLNASIEFSGKENYGVEYLKPLIKFLGAVQEHRAALNQYLNGELAAKEGAAAIAVKADIISEEVSKSDAKLNAELKTSEKWNAVKEKWNALKNLKTQLSAVDNLTKHDELAAGILTLIIDIADISNLTLDPDVDSYYLTQVSHLKNRPSSLKKQ